MTKKMLERTDSIEKAIEKWEQEHMPKTASIDEDNYSKVFASIFAFRGVVDIIDKEIAENDTSLLCKKVKATIPAAVSDGDITLKIRLVNTPKYKTFAGRWDELDDIRVPASVPQQFIDIIKLRYANYMGFIHSIIDYDYIIYEIEE